tara:strand:+ start:1045 stop:1509 length:465 start_codon:yes stop_codon:yes gene_type:complete
MYVFAPNQTVETFPYSIGNLRRDNPNTSFPRNPSDELLAEWNVFPVVKQDRPTFDTATQDLNETNPTLSSNQWLQTWSVTAASSDEIAQRTTDKQAEVRAQRDQLIAETDWVVVMAKETGTNIAAAMKTYRQALRDLPSADGFPHTMTWPTKPS